MARFGFTGPAYQSESLNVDAQRCVNFFPESNESGWGKTATALYPDPGCSLFRQLIGPSVRGLIRISPPGQFEERVFAVSGANFYELFSDGGATIRNDMNPFIGSGIVSMANSPTQILIIDGGQAYCYSLATNTFQPLQTYTPGLGDLSAPFSVAAEGAGYTVGDNVSPAIGGTGGVFTVATVLPTSGGGIFGGGTTIASGGTGYIVGDAVVPASGGTGAILTINSVSPSPGGVLGLTSSPIANGGANYSIGDIVVPAGPGSGAQVRVTSVLPTTGGNLTIVIVQAGGAGTGYTAGDIVIPAAFPGTGGLIQINSVDFFGGVLVLSVFNPGINYINATNVSCSGGSGSGLVVDISASPVVSGFVSGVLVVTGGSGYMGASSVATTGGTGTGLRLNTTATPAVGQVLGLVVTVPGMNYVTTAGVAMVGGSGTGLVLNIAALPIVSGAVDTVTLTNPGSGYAPSINAPTTGGTGSGLQLNFSTTSLSPMSGMLTNPILCAQIDGFFIVLQANSQVIQVSQPEDASAWDPTQVSQVSVFPDNIVSMLAEYRQLWLWGSRQSQVYFDSGNLFPFDIVQGGYLEQGCGAALSPVRLDNSVMWLGQDERGSAIAWRANGYQPVRISNYAIEWEWQGYSTVADAISYAWQYSGHSFWQIYFPTAGKTWVYDAASNSWHERTSWNAAMQAFGAHQSQCHVFAFGRHLIGDWNSGNVYEMGENDLTDNGNSIQRIRISPYIFKEHNWIYHSKLEFDVEMGAQPVPPLYYPVIPTNPLPAQSAHIQIEWDGLKTISLPSPVTAANLLVVFASASLGSALTISDNQSNAWTSPTTPVAGIQSFCAEGAAPGMTTITLGNMVFGEAAYLMACEISGIDPSASVDSAVVDLSGPSIALMTVNPNDFIITFCLGVVDPPPPPAITAGPESVLIDTFSNITVGPSTGNWNPVNSATGHGSTTTVVGTAFGSSMTVGSLILVAVVRGNTTDTILNSDVTDTAGNIYSDVGVGAIFYQPVAVRDCVQLLYAVNQFTTASNAVTVQNANTSSMDFQVYEFVPSGSAIGIDGVAASVQNANSPGSGIFSAGPVTTVNNGALIVGWASAGTSLTPGAGFATPSAGNAELIYQTQSAAGTTNAIWNGPAATNWAGICVAFYHSVPSTALTLLTEYQIQQTAGTYASTCVLATTGGTVSGAAAISIAFKVIQPPLIPRPPVIGLDWSDDQARTWSNEHLIECGLPGDYSARAYIMRLGRSRGRVYRVTCTDPIPWKFADAYLEASPGFTPQERLSAQIGKMG